MEAGQPGTGAPGPGVTISAAPAQRTVTIAQDQVRGLRSAPHKLDASGFVTSKWSADGTIEQIPAPAAIVEALKAMAPAAPSQAPEDRAKPGKLDPEGIEPVSGKQDKVVFGKDERSKIKDTTRYPFSTVVQIVTEFPDGTLLGCSGTVIGTNHVLTAASCVFDTETNAWPKSIDVYPGRDGNRGPLGAFAGTGLAVPNGFSDAQKGVYDYDRMQYDVAVVSFNDPIGNTTGWMAYGYDDGLPVFVGNLVGYPSDKDNTMWHASCEIDPKQIEPNFFAHQCDLNGNTGASIYQYVKSRDERTIYAVQVGSNQDANYAVRITGPWFDWIRGIKNGN